MSFPSQATQAAKQLLALKNAESNFLDFIRYLHPEWSIPNFQFILASALDLLEKRELKSGFTGKLTPLRSNQKKPKLSESNFCGRPVYNLMINMPPRHAKSTFATQLFPAYFMGRDPRRHIMSTSYNSTLAVDFGRSVRAYIENPRYTQVFPQMTLNRQTRAADAWRTTENGNYFSIGMDGTTSGRPANLLILDDPIKNRREAESATTRNNAWNFYQSALTTRLQPEIENEPPIQIVILTRWHPDDPGGRIQQTEDWKEGLWAHINFPAVIETESEVLRPNTMLPPDDPRYLKPMESAKVSKWQRHHKAPKRTALWPERFPLSTLDRIERQNPREFAALYLQNPYIEGGNLIKTEWWRYYDNTKETPNNIIIAGDTAFSKKENADYSVFITLAMDDIGDIYILDVLRKRLDYPQLREATIKLNNKYRGRGLRSFYLEDRASGQSLIQDLRHNAGVNIIPHKPGTSEKVARAHNITPMIESGRVHLPNHAKWLDAFIDECVTFPDGKHDDQVDALVIGLDALSKTPVTPTFAPLSTPLFSSDLNPTTTKHQLTTHRRWRGWGI